MTKAEYTAAVCAALRRLTPRERASVREEIDGHIEDHMADLLALDYPEDLAEQRALSAMGDPEEVGKAISRQYSPFWLAAGRLAAAALVLLALMVLTNAQSWAGLMADNLQARWAPGSAVPEWMEQVHQETDIRLEVGSDVLYIFGVGADAETGIVTVLSCWYDQNPLGLVSGNTVTFQDCRGQVLPGGGVGGPYDAAADFRRQSLSVLPGDPYVTVVCERYGARYTAQVPLVWEDGL